MIKKSDVLRNPLRKMDKRPEPYQPEYIRLGFDPPKPLLKKEELRTDFEYALNKRTVAKSKPQQKSQTYEKPDMKSDPLWSRRMHGAKIGQENFQEKNEMKKYPKQKIVSSGFNHEHTWHPTATYFDEETIPADQFNEETYPMEGFNKSESELELEEIKARTGRIKFDEIDDPDDGQLKKPWVQKQEFRQLSISDDVLVNEYCLMIEGQISFISKSLEEMEAAVEYILFDKNSDDISVEDICVFKRLQLKAGVVIKE